MSVTSELCHKIAGTHRGALTGEAVAAAQRLVLDGLAVAVAGSREDAIRILADHVASQGALGDATVLGHGTKRATVAAASLNGAAMHVLDFEPMWSPANHALSTTLPAVLALAETTDAPGSEVLTALVKGIEVQGWLRQASRQWEARNLVFHPPGVVGPIGAAVAAGHLLALDEHRLAHAIGIAASRSASLLANVGTMTKSTHCGHAAAAGLESALLAARGFTANPHIFDVAQGFPQAFSPELVAEELLGFGPPFRLVDPGFAVKMFPCQFGTHFGITAALTLHRQLPAAAVLRAVHLQAPVMPYVDRPRPESGLAGKFSLQYTVAGALLDGFVGLGTFRDERLERADMQQLLPRIRLTMSPDIPGRFEDMFVLLDIELADGQTLRTRCDGPAGIWGSPPIAAADHLAKITDCLGAVLPQPQIDELVDLAGRLDQLTNPQVRQLISMAGGASVSSSVSSSAAPVA